MTTEIKAVSTEELEVQARFTREMNEGEQLSMQMGSSYQIVSEDSTVWTAIYFNGFSLLADLNKGTIESEVQKKEDYEELEQESEAVSEPLSESARGASKLITLATSVASIAMGLSLSMLWALINTI
jgi:hypothetical protein